MLLNATVLLIKNVGFRGLSENSCFSIDYSRSTGLWKTTSNDVAPSCSSRVVQMEGVLPDWHIITQVELVQFVLQGIPRRFVNECVADCKTMVKY